MKKTALLEKIRKNIVVTESITFASAMGEKNLSTNAASITFFFFISVIPIFILLCSMLPFTGISEAELTQAITEITPKAINDLVESLISEAYSAKMGIFSISVVFLLWSSSKGMLALVRSLDFIYDEDDNRSYWQAYCCCSIQRRDRQTRYCLRLFQQNQYSELLQRKYTALTLLQPLWSCV